MGCQLSTGYPYMPTAHWAFMMAICFREATFSYKSYDLSDYYRLYIRCKNNIWLIQLQPCQVSDYRHTGKHLRLVMTLLCLKLGLMLFDPRTDGRTDGCYQVDLNYFKGYVCSAHVAKLGEITGETRVLYSKLGEITGKTRVLPCGWGINHRVHRNKKIYVTMKYCTSGNIYLSIRSSFLWAVDIMNSVVL